MYILIVLIFSEVQASGTATLSFVFPSAEDQKVLERVGEAEEVKEPKIKLESVKHGKDSMVVKLSSGESLEFSVVAFYGNGVTKKFEGGVIDGVKKVKVPIVLCGSGRKVRWVNILWKNDGLVVCNASNDYLGNLASAPSLEQHEEMPQLAKN